MNEIQNGKREITPNLRLGIIQNVRVTDPSAQEIYLHPTGDAILVQYRVGGVRQSLRFDYHGNRID